MNAIDFDCPECGAKAGERCHTYTGKMQPVSHVSRKRAAFEEEELRRKVDQEGPAPSVTKPEQGT
ncbi:MAG TPA: hypothetical protein VMT39_01865 [Candidatus Bathyarchaeia archaeon]|nr:hypothetical protein [Candidatus Bathyarchaeia archaeon]